MTPDEFNEYREKYGKMSADDLTEWHSLLYYDNPDQKHYDIEAIMDFFSKIDAERVIEIGGWDGEVADLVLDKHQEITVWTNYEVCVDAVLDTKCSYIKYRALPFALYEVVDQGDTLIMSHVIEHMSNGQLMGLIGTTDAKNVYIDSPIDHDGQSWDNSTSFHVLTIGWNQVHELMGMAGYRLIMSRGTARGYTR